MDQPLVSGTKSNNALYIMLAIVTCVVVFVVIGVLAWIFWPSGTTLDGHWTGYTDKGVKGGYDWVITQTGNNLSVTDNNNPNTKTTGTISGNNITMGWGTTGTLSSDSNTINWSDKTYWTRNSTKA